jgi:hypothetical protein
MDKDIHDTYKRRDLLRRHQAREDKMLFQAKCLCLSFKSLTPGSIADKQEFYFRALLNEAGGNGKEVVMAFELEEARNLADDEIIGQEAKTGAEGEVIGGGEERFEGKAAQDRGVLGASPDASGEVLARHGFGDHNKVRGDAGSVALGRTENEIREKALKRAEGRAVHRVNNDGDTGTGSGEAAEDSSFAAVGMDNIWAIVAKDGLEVAQGEPVIQWMDGTDKMRFEAQETGQRVKERFEGTFRPARGARNETDLETLLLPEAKDGGNGIFLSAADDQPGDDMGDPHCGGQNEPGLRSRRREMIVLASTELVAVLARAS